MSGSSNLHNDVETWRLGVFAGAVVFVFIVFVIRLFSLQVLQNQDWQERANDNSVETISLAALRGIIYDRNDIILARNVASYNIVITAADLPDDEGAVQEIYRELSALIDVPVSQSTLSAETPYVPCTSDHGIAQIAEYGASSTPYDPVRVKCDVDEQLARIVQEKAVDWPGVSVEISPIRDYPTNSLTSSIIGFLGPIPADLEDEYIAQGLVPNRDKVGYAGLELQHQTLLAGKNGQRVVEVDVGGQIVRDMAPPEPSTPGLNLRLTIDTRFQQATEAILKKDLDDWNSWFGEVRYSAGVVIAINPKTGEILSMVSYPNYENNRMARFIPAYYYDQLVNDPTNPLLNHAVGDVLPAGSVFKLVTGVGALNEGVVTPEQIIETPGKLVVTEKYYANDPGQSRDFVDWIYKKNPGGFGALDFVHGMANSSNVYFYKLGGGFEDEVPEGLGICRLKTYAEAMGYGDAPGIGLPDEQKGLLPDPRWKRINQAESWSSGDTYISSVGQGYVLATPLQVLLSAAIVANNGKFMQPTLIHDVLDTEGNETQPFTPVMKWDITDPENPIIKVFGETTIRGCEEVEGQKKHVEPWVLEKVREGMRLAVTIGTLKEVFDGANISAAGKTGTAEYCDTYANARGLCIPGSWPAHAWTVAFAPYDSPEIAVVVYVYNGTEGSTVAGPIVRKVLEAYFELKRIDNALQAPK